MILHKKKINYGESKQLMTTMPLLASQALTNAGWPQNFDDTQYGLPSKMIFIADTFGCRQLLCASNSCTSQICIARRKSLDRVSSVSEIIPISPPFIPFLFQLSRMAALCECSLPRSFKRFDSLKKYSTSTVVFGPNMPDVNIFLASDVGWNRSFRLCIACVRLLSINTTNANIPWW